MKKWEMTLLLWPSCLQVLHLFLHVDEPPMGWGTAVRGLRGSVANGIGAWALTITTTLSPNFSTSVQPVSLFKSWMVWILQWCAESMMWSRIVLGIIMVAPKLLRWAQPYTDIAFYSYQLLRVVHKVKSDPAIWNLGRWEHCGNGGGLEMLVSRKLKWSGLWISQQIDGWETQQCLQPNNCDGSQQRWLLSEREVVSKRN